MWVLGDLKKELGILPRPRNRKRQFSSAETAPIKNYHDRSISEATVATINDGSGGYEPAFTHSPGEFEMDVAKPRVTSYEDSDSDRQVSGPHSHPPPESSGTTAVGSTRHTEKWTDSSTGLQYVVDGDPNDEYAISPGAHHSSSPQRSPTGLRPVGPGVHAFSPSPAPSYYSVSDIPAPSPLPEPRYSYYTYSEGQNVGSPTLQPLVGGRASIRSAGAGGQGAGRWNEMGQRERTRTGVGAPLLGDRSANGSGSASEGSSPNPSLMLSPSPYGGESGNGNGGNGNAYNAYTYPPPTSALSSALSSPASPAFGQGQGQPQLQPQSNNPYSPFLSSNTSSGSTQQIQSHNPYHNASGSPQVASFQPTSSVPPTSISAPSNPRNRKPKPDAIELHSHSQVPYSSSSPSPGLSPGPQAGLRSPPPPSSFPGSKMRMGGSGKASPAPSQFSGAGARSQSRASETSRYATASEGEGESVWDERDGEETETEGEREASRAEGGAGEVYGYGQMVDGVWRPGSTLSLTPRAL